MPENVSSESSERARKIQLLHDLFCYVLAEDSTNGTQFDMDVMRALSSLREKYRGETCKVPSADEIILVFDGRVGAVKIDEKRHDFMTAVLRRITEVYRLTPADALLYLADLGAKKTPRFTPEWMR